MGRWLDAAFGAFRSRKSEEEKERFSDGLASAITNKMFGPPMSEEELRELKRRERLAEEGWRIRRERIASMGVDVDLFTREKVLGDALNVAHGFFPATRTLEVGTRNAQVRVDFQNLTKTGRLPKNVACASVCCDSSPKSMPEETLIVNLKYLRDGSLNMADVIAWRNKVGINMSVRLVNGIHRITYITRTDALRDLYDPLYAIDSDNRDPREVANDALRNAR